MKKLISALLLKGKKYSPEIALVGGIGLVVTGTVLACRRTLYCEAILARHNEQREMIEEAKEADSETYDESKQKHDIVALYTQTAIEFVKNYALPASMVVGGISLICLSHGIMRKRNAMLMASYTALQSCMDAYRERVKEKVGEDVEHELFHGYKREKVDAVDEETGKKKKEEVINFEDSVDASPYAKFFDESSRYWKKDPDANLLFLKGVQNAMNDRLKIFGHVFLNDVYEALDIPHTTTGALCGWVEGNGDDYIDFGIFDENNCAKRRFVNGYENCILLDFNVDGLIYNMI